MSSERIREWEKTLPPELKEKIEKIIDDITQEMDAVIRHEGNIDNLIKKFILLCDEIGLPREETSVFMKHKLKGIVSDDIIERHLPADRKRKHKSYETYRQLEEIRNTGLPKKELLVDSSSGSESVTDLNGKEREREEEIPPTREEVLETSAEIALSTVDELTRTLKDTDARLKEAFSLIADKDNEIERQRLQLGELEIRISDLQKKSSKVSTKDVDALEDLQVKYDEVAQAYRELREVEMLRTQKEDFKPASQVKSPPIAWLAAVNLSQFCRVLLNLSMNLSLKQLEKKILFDVTDDGQLKNPRAESAP